MGEDCSSVADGGCGKDRCSNDIAAAGESGSSGWQFLEIHDGDVDGVDGAEILVIVVVFAVMAVAVAGYSATRAGAVAGVEKADVREVETECAMPYDLAGEAKP